MSEAGVGKARILVADDEPHIREILCERLGEEYVCAQAGSAEDALGQLRAAPFDLVLSDIVMGGMTGLEMVPHVLALAPDTVVMIISGQQQIEGAIEAMRAGAFDYVTKPFDLHHVEVAVRRALEHRGLLVAKRRYENFLEGQIARRTQELGRTLNSLADSYHMTLKALAAALETRDHETQGHSERVVSFSLRLGREMNLNEEQLRALEFGALLHDVGKIGVPDAILHKPARLTEDEWARMRLHPALGQQILRGIEFLEGASRVVGQHHEKWDGTGYPAGVRGEEIDLNARIFAVADAFDAITSHRVYRPGRSYETAAAELRDSAGAHFDPAVVAAFHRVPREEWDQLRRESLVRWQERRAVLPGAPAPETAESKIVAALAG